MSVMTEEEMDYQIELNELHSKTDDIEKSNFNPQMLESCTDTSYQCGYQQGRKDERAEIINIIENCCWRDVEMLVDLIKEQ